MYIKDSKKCAHDVVIYHNRRGQSRSRVIERRPPPSCLRGGGWIIAMGDNLVINYIVFYGRDSYN